MSIWQMRAGHAGGNGAAGGSERRSTAQSVGDGGEGQGGAGELKQGEQAEHGGIVTWGRKENAKRETQKSKHVEAWYLLGCSVEVRFMVKHRKTSRVESGEAGHQGHDRQPSKHAAPGEVQARSRESVRMKMPRHNRPDMTGPGPEREEEARSKGNAHHDQRETKRDMDEGLEEL